MGLPAQLYNKVLAALFTKLYLTLSMTPKQTADILRNVISSYNDTSYIANFTGSAVQEVNRTMQLIYQCVNSSIAANNTVMYRKCLTPTTTTPVSTTVNCANLQYDLNALVLYILLLFSVSFLVVMSFIEKRKYRVKCCNGRPGVVVPVNLLDSYENRVGNALAFGATTSYCLHVFITGSKSILGSGWGTIIDSSPGYVSIFFDMLATIVIALAAYPLFVAMRTSHKRAGSIFGIFYCVLWIGLQAIEIVVFSSSCLNSATHGSTAKRTMIILLFGELPKTICLLGLLRKFIMVLIKAIRRRAERKGDAEDVYDNFNNGYMFKHVQNLLRHTSSSSTPKLDDSTKSKLKGKLYKWKPEFQYSTRVLCTFTVSGTIVYLLMMNLLYICWYIDIQLGALSETEGFESVVKSLVPNDKNVVKTVRAYLEIWTDCLYAAIVLSAIKTVLVFFNMLSWYREHRMRLRGGDRSWLPSSIRTVSPSSLFVASMKYAGFQVAYASWGD